MYRSEIGECRTELLGLDRCELAGDGKLLSPVSFRLLLFSEVADTEWLENEAMVWTQKRLLQLQVCWVMAAGQEEVPERGALKGRCEPLQRQTSVPKQNFSLP